MQHLNEQDLVLHHYHDGEAPAEAEQHLAACAACRNELESIRRVLAAVDDMPVPDRGDRYGEQVWSRLRWRLGSRRRWNWQSIAAAAAVLAIAFLAGALWYARNGSSTVVRSAAATAVASPVATHESPRDRILLVVVSDHLDSSERMLLDLANADPKHGLDVSAERKRAEALLTSNEIYRDTAAQRGHDRLAALLSELEPILIEIANSDAKLTPEELTALQKRIDSRNLLFKVRVASAQTRGI